MSREMMHDVSQLLVSLVMLAGSFTFLFMIFFSGVTVDSTLKESLNQTTGAVLAMIGGVAGFWIGTSLSSVRKDAVIANTSRQGGFVKQGFLGFLLAVSVIGLATPLLHGCITTEAPKTFDDRYAVAIIELTSFREAGTEALRAGSITADDAKRLLKIEDQARELLDAALTAKNISDSLTAENKLALATSLLGSLQNYVRTQGVKK